MTNQSIALFDAVKNTTGGESMKMTSLELADVTNKRHDNVKRTIETLVKPGGSLVAIAGEGVFFGSDAKARAFREWLSERGDTDPKEGDVNADGLVFRDGRWHRDNRQKIDDTENARIENSTVSIGLSPESARDTRIARKIAAAPNPADKARLQGYYDFMLGKDNAAKKQSKISEVSYLQGWKRGQDQRERSNGLPWYETEKSRDVGKWSWSIYREGLHQKSGEASSEKNADLDIEVAKADLMDAHDDWSKKARPLRPPKPT